MKTTFQFRHMVRFQDGTESVWMSNYKTYRTERGALRAAERMVLVINPAYENVREHVLQVVEMQTGRIGITEAA